MTIPDNHVFIYYKYGFVFYGVTFCWKNKQLYRMPYLKNKRAYEKRLLKSNKRGGYCVCGVQKSLKNLKEITKVINYKEMVFIFRPF